LPLLLLVGGYLLPNRVARVSSIALLAAWFVWVVVLAVVNRQWNVLMFPALVGIAWVVASEAKRSTGK
jgi:hypothetical protein